MKANEEQGKEQPLLIERRLTLPNDIETITQLNEFIDKVCEKLGLDTITTSNMNLAVEEAVVNVMSYGYPVGTSGDVDIDARATEAWLEFVISDSGIPFDPTKKADADITLSAEERPIGGLGIHLIRNIMDVVGYSYTDPRNILTLRKNIK